MTIAKYFTSAVTGRWKRTTISFHVQSLRSFFSYASSRGWCAVGIAESIDAPRVYTHENLPQGPAWEDVKKLVTRVNGTSPVQIRSRCAILLCSVYGLRVGEVCCLRLEDIDWAEERISVRRPKQRKAQTYPLTTQVGNALLRYLKEVRPRRPHREVLLTLRRPYRPVSVGALSTMTRKLQKRLGLKLKRYGSHVLRHACATHLLAQGLTLKEVGDHLGHMSVAATRIYAKVDLVGLREVASLDVRPLVDCIQQCEQSAAPLYRIRRDPGSAGCWQPRAGRCRVKITHEIHEFILYKQSLGMTYKNRALKLTAFARLAGPVEMDAISPETVRRFLDAGRPVTAEWFNKFSALKMFFRFALSRGYATRNSLPLSQPKSPRQFRPYIYSVEEVQKMIRVVDNRHRGNWHLEPYTIRTLLLLLYGTGLRIGEAIRLQHRDVDLHDAILTVRETKFHKTRLVPVSSDLTGVLRGYFERKWKGLAPQPALRFWPPTMDALSRI